VNGSTRTDVLVSTEWLAARLDDPDVRVVEVVVNTKAYDEGHIPGAVVWNIYADLKDAEYRLVDTPLIEALLAKSGITADTLVVFYGYAPAFGFWLMSLYGHANVKVLDASRDTWRAEGRPWTAAVAIPNLTDYRLAREDSRIRVRQAELDEAIGTPRWLIVDARTAAEYQGERFWPSGGMEPGGNAGHIPGARHVPIDGIYDDRGAFRDDQDLRRVFEAALAIDDAITVAPYCTIGGRATTTWFVLTRLLGRENVRVYDGSWAEWGRTPGARVEAGVLVS